MRLIAGLLRGWAACGGATVVALSLALGAVTGCSTPSRTRIEQGSQVTTGSAPYDAFFQEVLATHEETREAETLASGARAGLSRSLGLQEAASREVVLDAARARAAKLREEGVLLHLQLTPEVKVVRAGGKKGLDDDGKEILDALEASAKGGLSVSKQLDQLASRVTELERKRAELDQELSMAFASAPSSQRREVQRELDAAGKVLAEAKEGTDLQAALVSKFVLDLAIAVETGASPGEARGDTKRSGARPTGRPAPRRGGPPAAQPPPKPAGGSDDFEF
ncbi:hypothetical protein [Chondromyces crocatus]|uniref:Lipoprotein n=1 Tax=Chondromyces crocatus TaxID=52 RepID=A0A0K1ES29_CHOCO|nr:hypothetical protein [Chondromyces crocatus]AKT43428.1 uncharacterized protein CMC5_076600 [Chondromyces crocatus]